MMNVIAHRGMEHRMFGENTFHAIATAVLNGFDVEFDVRLTADGIPVISHDDEVLDTRRISHSISQERLDTLRASEISRPLAILESILTELLGRKTLHIELKTSGTAKALHQLIQRLSISESSLATGAVISSFDVRELVICQSILPSVPRAWLTNYLPSESKIEELVLRKTVEAVHLEQSHVQADFVRWLQEGYNLQVRAWTVNTPEQAIAFAAMGVGGVFTDNALLIERTLR